jgi:hypothetical protein
MTYAELAAAIAALSPEQLHRPVEAYEFAGRAYAITGVFTADMRHGILDDGQPYLAARFDRERKPYRGSSSQGSVG